MAFPTKFDYSNEDDFIQRFLIPLLNRMGFSVVNYHGVQEFGRDLIFAEIDRFGHVRYHALQAKYVSSISKSDSHGLVQDCCESFVNPFSHPQTGVSERISTFYVANGGDISDTARTHFFNSLVQYGGNVRLLDGKSLLSLDRWAAFNRNEMIGETLTGLILEIRSNRPLIQPILRVTRDNLMNETNPLPNFELRGHAMSNFLVRPPTNSINTDFVLYYSSNLNECNHFIKTCENAFLNRTSKVAMLEAMVIKLEELSHLGDEIERQAMAVLGSLGPLTGF